MEIIFHGGMHKTGTTFVQTWLRENRALLSANGIWRLTPKDKQILAHAPGKARWHNLSEAVEAARSAGATRVIISHEGLSLMDGPSLSLLVNSLPAVRKRFILALRHWNGFLPSRWKQNVVRADSQSFGRMVARLRAADSVSINLRYDILFERIISAGFDDVRIVSYDRAVQQGGILAAILEAADIAAPLGATTLPGPVNESVDTLTADVLRIVNGVRAQDEGKGPNPLHDARENPAALIHYFDHNRRLIRPLMDSAFPEIVDLLSDTWPVALRGADFLPLANRLDRLVAPFLMNPTDGRLFPEIPDRDHYSSPLECDDLPADSLKRVMDVVREVILPAV